MRHCHPNELLLCILHPGIDERHVERHNSGGLGALQAELGLSNFHSNYTHHPSFASSRQLQHDCQPLSIPNLHKFRPKLQVRFRWLDHTLRRDLDGQKSDKPRV